MIRLRIVEEMPEQTDVPSIEGLLYYGSDYRTYKVVIEEPQEVISHDMVMRFIRDEGMTTSAAWKPVEIIWDLTNKDE